jgi:TRAP-type C4-dicarboxylate transport system substrate-binding protein
MPNLRLLSSAGIALAAALASAVMGGAASAQDTPVTLRFSHWSPPQHPMSQIAVPDWVNAIEKASNGSIKIQVFPAQQLGKAIDHYDIGRDGVADISWANAGLQPGRFPVAQALEMPWLYSDPAGATLAFDEWYRPLAQKEMKDVHVCLLHALFPSVVHSKRELKSIDDFKGLKIRTANATQARYASGMGAVIVPVPAPEARDAIEKGVADSILFPWQSLIIFGIDNILNYHMDAPFSGNGFELMLNKAAYDRLSPNQKKVIDAHCTPEWSARFASAWNKMEADGRGTLAAKPGHVLYKPSDKFMSDVRAAVDPVKKEWADSVRKAGYDPDALWNALMEKLKKHNAT